MRVLYFAWLRERTGLSEEEIDPPSDVRTVGDLLSWLKERGPEFAHAFADESIVRVALDRTHVQQDTPLDNAREVAFFPPMTGG